MAVIDEVDRFSFGEVFLGLCDDLARVSARVLGDRASPAVAQPLSSSLERTLPEGPTGSAAVTVTFLCSIGRVVGVMK